MKKIIIAAFLLSFTMLLKAQVPGYLGKKGVVEVHFLIPIVEELLLTPYFKVQGEYAIKRQRSVSLEYRLMNTTQSGYTSTGSIEKVPLSHSMAMARYNFYKSDWTLAPYGKYWSLGIGYNMVKGGNASNFASTNFFSAHIGWGQRFIIAKRFTLNYGFETGLPFGGEVGSGRIAFTLFNGNFGAGILF